MAKVKTYEHKKRLELACTIFRLMVVCVYLGVTLCCNIALGAEANSRITKTMA